MKKRIKSAALWLNAPLPLIAILLASGCACVPRANPHADYPEERAHIEQVLKQIFDAAEKKDLERLDSYHFYGPKFTKFSGPSNNRQDAAVARQGEHDGLKAINDLKMRADDLKIDVFGDAAVATFILNSSFKAGAETMEKKDRGTLVFVKDHGAWKITHEHFSTGRP